MKGRVAQRAWYDRIPAVLADAMAEWEVLTGRRYGLIDALPDGRRRAHRRRDGHHRRQPARCGRPPARAGRPRRRRRRDLVPTVPCRAARSDPRQRASGRSRRADRRTGSVRQSAHPRAESRTRRSGRRRHAHSACRLGLGGTRVARRLVRRPGRGLRLAAPTKPRCVEQPYAVLGVKHPLALDDARHRAAPARRVQPARPFDRRLRVRDRQQAAGERHRRPVRPLRPGLSALRLGEARPADDLLPDHRRRADPPAQRAAPRRACAAPRRRARSARAIRSPASSTAARSS